MKRIPIKTAKDIAEKYDANIVIITAWDTKTGTSHVTTYGRSREECIWAAAGGNQIKRDLLKWPEEECHAQPARAKIPVKQLTCLHCKEKYTSGLEHTCLENDPCEMWGCENPKPLNRIMCVECEKEYHEDPEAFK